MTQRLRELYDSCGQSPWLDNLQRSYLTNGKLAELIKNGIRGLTSNPTIFQKAIQGSTDYDEQFHAELNRGLSVRQAYWEMVIQDIIGALDAFSPLHVASGGVDGYVSVEVDPSLARDTHGTITAARDLHMRIDRPNVMIKIPATVEGLHAVTTMVSEGRSVNVTLIFSLDRYREVAESYLKGLELLARADGDLSRVSSVASFFISRVDSEVDARLTRLNRTDLKGKAAIAQARLVYEIFSETFSIERNPRWAALAARGARPQRPLWASTSTKNPEYSDTLYVDELIGPNTVNTLPEPTLESFQAHGRVHRTIDADMATMRTIWEELSVAGIDMADVAATLETEGVSSFIKSFEDLIATLEEKVR